MRASDLTGWSACGTLGQPFKPHQRPPLTRSAERGADRPPPCRVGVAVDGDVHRNETTRRGRQAARRLDGGRRALRVCNRLRLPRHVVEAKPGGAVGGRAARHAGRDGRVLERQPAVRIETRGDDLVDRVQIEAGDLVAPFDQNVGQVLLRHRVAELAGVDRRPDQVVGEDRDPSRRPECVIVAQFQVGLRRRLRPPRAGIETIALELADRRASRRVRFATGSAQSRRRRNGASWYLPGKSVPN